MIYCNTDPEYSLTSTSFDFSIKMNGYEDNISIFILFLFWLTPFTIIAIFSFLIPGILFWKRYQRRKLATTNNTTQKVEFKITLMFSVVTSTTFIFLVPDILMAAYYNTLYRYAVKQVSPYSMSASYLYALEMLEIICYGKNFLLYNLVSTDFRNAHIALWKSAATRWRESMRTIGSRFQIK